jgi:hypothetical protein
MPLLCNIPPPLSKLWLKQEKRPRPWRGKRQVHPAFSGAAALQSASRCKTVGICHICARLTEDGSPYRLLYSVGRGVPPSRLVRGTQLLVFIAVHTNPPSFYLHNREQKALHDKRATNSSDGQMHPTAMLDHRTPPLLNCHPPAVPAPHFVVDRQDALLDCGGKRVGLIFSADGKGLGSQC